MVIVYAVDCREASANRTLDSLQPMLGNSDVVGLSVASADLGEYARISDRDFNRQRARLELAGFLKDKYNYDFDVNETCGEESPGAPIGAHFFYFAIFHALRSKAHVVGVGSERKTRIVNEHVDWINEYDRDDGLPPVESTERYTDYLLLAGPHFQSHLVGRSKEEKCDAVVVGMGHAEPVSRGLESQLVEINRVPERVHLLNESLREIYQRRKHLLPDIQD